MPPVDDADAVEPVVHSERGASDSRDGARGQQQPSEDSEDDWDDKTTPDGSKPKR
jgi:hypothetical protein